MNRLLAVISLIIVIPSFGMEKELWDAMLKHNPKTVAQLLEKVADVNAIVTYYDRRPLHIAAIVGDAGTVRMLLKKGALVDIQDQERNTALHLAVKEGHAEVVRTLIEAGATADSIDKGVSPVFRDARPAQTPLETAILAEHRDIAFMLIPHSTVNLDDLSFLCSEGQ